MNAVAVYAAALASVAIALALVWASQLRSRNANLVDPVWSWSLGWVGVVCAAFGTAPLAVRAMLALLSAGWALRLGTHLWLRNHGKPEDARYARFRERWGEKANRNLFWLIESQVVFTALLALPFVVVAWRDDLPPDWALVAAVVVWIIAVAGEGVADLQLARFRRDPANRNRVNRIGLWRYSRHPNYFFECVHWISYLFLAVGSSWWWVGLIAPVVMAFLVLKVSGVPMTEQHMAQSRPGYAEYMQTTSAFVPWPPKKKD